MFLVAGVAPRQHGQVQHPAGGCCLLQAPKASVDALVGTRHVGLPDSSASRFCGPCGVISHAIAKGPLRAAGSGRWRSSRMRGTLAGVRRFGVRCVAVLSSLGSGNSIVSVELFRTALSWPAVAAVAALVAGPALATDKVPPMSRGRPR